MLHVSPLLTHMLHCALRNTASNVKLLRISGRQQQITKPSVSEHVAPCNCTGCMPMKLDLETDVATHRKYQPCGTVKAPLHNLTPKLAQDMA